MANAISEIANTQVSFSSRSVVLRTPITWFDALKLAASPPPFEFCTNTIRHSSMLTMIRRTIINVYMDKSAVVFLVQIVNEGCKVTAFFREFQGKRLIQLDGLLKVTLLCIDPRQCL